MGQTTAISWTDATWPVMRGCDKISPGCKFCWAIKDAHRMARNPNAKIAAHFSGLTQIEGGRPNWSGVVRLDEAILEWPLRWTKAKNVFVASSGDLFHERARTEDIDSVFTVMQHAFSRGHQFQVLTKRAERATKYLTDPALYERWLATLNWVRGRWSGLPTVPLSNPGRFPLGHVSIGFSAENQKYFDERWEHMRKLAEVGWLVWCSYEPALGAIDMRAALAGGLRWVVAGGESGHRDARPMERDWARSVRDQCIAARVPFHFKQWGDWLPPGQDGAGNPQRLNCSDVPERVGKKAAGRLLDGREWDEFPKNRMVAARS